MYMETQMKKEKNINKMLMLNIMVLPAGNIYVNATMAEPNHRSLVGKKTNPKKAPNKKGAFLYWYSLRETSTLTLRWQSRTIGRLWAKRLIQKSTQ